MKYSYNLMIIPEDIVNKILDFVRTDIGVLNKEDYKKKKIIYQEKSNMIKLWYKKYKIENEMPILFLDEMINMEKWYIIRLFMKFYPRFELYNWPIGYFKRITHVQNSNPNMVSGYLPSYPISFKQTNKAYDVFKFMHGIPKEEIIKIGF